MEHRQHTRKTQLPPSTRPSVMDQKASNRVSTTILISTGRVNSIWDALRRRKDQLSSKHSSGARALLRTGNFNHGLDSPDTCPHSCASDVHVTSDGVIVMFHDPSLERTTDGHGLIRTQPWHCTIEHVRTKARPHQQLPTFRDVCDLLMAPENSHVKLNVSMPSSSRFCCLTGTDD